MQRYPLLLVSLMTIAATAVSQSLKPPTIDQSLEMRTVGSPQISPDGTRVVYEESRTNWEANAFETELWIANPATGESHRLSAGSKSSRNAEWSPDGRMIAFLSDRPGMLAKSPEGKAQIYVMPADGGEAQQITKLEGGVDSFQWAPDSKRLVLTAEAPETKAMKDRKETFGDYHVIHADYEMVHLWTVEVPVANAAGVSAAAAEPKLLTPGETFSVESFDVSPDGAKIAFSAQRDPDLISSFSSDIYVVPTAGGTVQKIVDTEGPEGDPKWSPDGSQIAFTTSDASKYFFYTNQKVAVVSATGGKPRVVSGVLDEDPNLLRWAPTGIYVSALQKTTSKLFLIDPASGKLSEVGLAGTEIATGFSFSKDFSRAAYRGAAANQYAEIYTAGVSPVVAPVALTHVGTQLSGYATATEEVVHWFSGDKTPIEGVLYKPADFSPTKKYPLLMVIHGGPTGIDMPALSPDRYYPVERWVAKGALVLKPNYRGSAGYGEKFRALNVRNLGVGDYADVISGVDSLIRQGFVDKDRVGAMGWSEGGYISAFITTSSDRFQAVSVGAGISDWATYYGNTDITPFTAQYLKATPWDDPAHGGDPEIYKKTSPITYIAHAKTPTLIQQGSADRRVPVPNSYELRQALEDHGVPVKMVLYDGFGHPINKPKQQRAVMEENENWFNHYIWGEPLAPALTPKVVAKTDAK